MTNLPETFVEAEAIETIVHWLDLLRKAMTSEAGHAVFRIEIGKLQRLGVEGRLEAIRVAKAGHRDADMALRVLAAEFISQREHPPTELGEYMQWALMHPPAAGDPGREVADTWLRDLVIRVVVLTTVERFGVPQSRSRVSKNTRRVSACYLVSVALGRRGHNLSERRVENIVADRSRLAERLASTFLAP